MSRKVEPAVGLEPTKVARLITNQFHLPLWDTGILEIDWAVDLLPNRRAGFIAHAHQRGRDRTGVPVATAPHAAMILIGEHPDCPKRSTAYVDWQVLWDSNPRSSG